MIDPALIQLFAAAPFILLGLAAYILLVRR